MVLNINDKINVYCQIIGNDLDVQYASYNSISIKKKENGMITVMNVIMLILKPKIVPK